MYIEDNINQLKSNKFITLNLEIYYLIKSNKDYSNLVEDWSFVCDSIIIKYYLKFFKRRNVTLNQGHRLIYKMIESKMFNFLFLGSCIENLQLSEIKLKSKNSNINVEKDDLGHLTVANLDQTAKGIQASYDLNHFDAIFVALGAPKQDFFISRLNTRALIFGCGGTFEFLSGKVSYPPKAIECLGLTFCWRLFSDFSMSRLKKIVRTFRGGLRLIFDQDIH